MAAIVPDFERDLGAITVRAFDDGRFIVLVNRRPIFDMARDGGFPDYQQDIKPKLAAERQ